MFLVRWYVGLACLDDYVGDMDKSASVVWRMLSLISHYILDDLGCNLVGRTGRP